DPGPGHRRDRAERRTPGRLPRYRNEFFQRPPHATWRGVERRCPAGGGEPCCSAGCAVRSARAAGADVGATRRLLVPTVDLPCRAARCRCVQASDGAFDSRYSRSSGRPLMESIFLLKFIHVLGASVLFSTGIGIAFFMLMAHRTGHAGVIAVTARFVVVA